MTKLLKIGVITGITMVAFLAIFTATTSRAEAQYWSYDFSYSSGYSGYSGYYDSSYYSPSYYGSYYQPSYYSSYYSPSYYSPSYYGSYYSPSYVSSNYGYNRYGGPVGFNGFVYNSNDYGYHNEPRDDHHRGR